MPVVTPDEMAAAAQRVRLRDLDIVSAAGMGHIGGEFSVTDILVTLYLGVLDLEGRDRDHVVLSKGHAAVALYEARRKGTGAVELFNPAMVDDRAELVVLEAELRRAIERNEIEVHYQPIARLETGGDIGPGRDGAASGQTGLQTKGTVVRHAVSFRLQWLME